MSNWAKLQEDLMGKPVFKRAKHGIHFQNNDGSITANFSGKPCHYEDGGIWKPIDTKLLNTTDGWLGCAHSPVNIHPDGRVRVVGTAYLQRVELPSAQTGLADGDSLVRSFSFGNQRMWITEDGFRSEITLNRIPTLTEARKLIASESGTLSAQYLKSLTTATDASENVHVVTTLAAFRKWLASAKFPVTIDPDFAAVTESAVVNGNNTNFTDARSTSTTAGAFGTAYKYLGWLYSAPNYRIYRNYHKFDTSTIGAGSTVTQVNLKMTSINIYSAADYDIQIVKYNWSAFDADITNAANRETAWDALLTADLDDSIWVNRNSLSVNTPTTSGNLNTAWVSKTGTTYYGIITEGDRSDSATADYYLNRMCGAGYTTESYRPVLTVTYAAAGVPKHFMHYQRMRG